MGNKTARATSARIVGRGDATSYEEFLRHKMAVAPNMGVTCRPGDFNRILKPHQRDIAKWAVEGGRRAIFCSFGLGKTIMQLEVLRVTLAKAGGRGLIICPLGVRQEFVRDAREVLKWRELPRFIRSVDEAGETGVYLTNYETVRDGKIDPNAFTAVSLDEASVLRSFGSLTYQTFLRLFTKVKYRFVATATPSPNRFKELIHYAGFLGVMDTGQALTRFFQRDSTKSNNLTLYPHKEAEFWLWLSSWAVFVQRPSDLGYGDEGYDLPPMTVRYHVVSSYDGSHDVDRDGQAALFRDPSLSAASAAREKRVTLTARVAKMVEILQGDPTANYILWHDLEAEREAIEAAVPSAVSVYGSQDLEERERAIIQFSDGEFQYLAAKPVIAGSGCNFQRHCHKAIFLGVGFKFNDFIQAVHRIQRFQQQHPVEIHIIHADTEHPILKVLEGKWTNHEHMVNAMSDLIRKNGLNNLDFSNILMRSLGVRRVEASGNGWVVANNDCVVETRAMAENSVDLVVTSIPFSNHYEYTELYNDFGHTDSDAHFFEQLDYLTPEVLRVLKPGRVACIHVKDRILFGSVTGTGMPTVNPFHAKCIEHYMRHGFAYMGMITVVTDVVRENNQTYRLGWSEQCKDGTKMGVGSPEYILLLRKLPSDLGNAYADEPVKKSKADYTRARWQVDAHAFWRSSGERLMTADELAKLQPSALATVFTKHSLTEVYDYDTHVRIGEDLEARGALPATFMSLAPGSHHPDVWHDVNRMRTLNGEQARRNVELHVCPLQFDIVDRLISRFSSEGETVFDPFGGLMTVPVRALKLKRNGRGVELHPGYFLDGVRYLEMTEREMATPTLFEMIEAEMPAAAEAAE